MKPIITALIFILPLWGLSQGVSRSEILPRQKYNHLENSPTTLTCDSLGLFSVIGTFYTNKMPMADNNKIIWNCWIGQGNGQPIDGANPPMCPKLEIRKIYLFYDKEVYLFSYEGVLNKEPKKIYAPPVFVVIEYYDTIVQKTGFIRSLANSFKCCSGVD